MRLFGITIGKRPPDPQPRCERIGIIDDALYRGRFLYGIVVGNKCMTPATSTHLTPEDAWAEYHSTTKPNQ